VNYFTGRFTYVIFHWRFNTENSFEKCQRSKKHHVAQKRIIKLQLTSDASPINYMLEATEKSTVSRNMKPQVRNTVQKSMGFEKQILATMRSKSYFTFKAKLVLKRRN
jgi:hypothetical protein